jgi:hypothetical protein
MGVVKISNTTSSNWSGLRAQRVAPVAGSGDPGCVLIQSDAEILTIGGLNANRSVNVALPYGTWKITRGTSTSVTPLAAVTRGSVSSNVVTLDPRTVVAP